MTEIAMGYQKDNGDFVVFRDDVDSDEEWREVERIAGVASGNGTNFRKKESGFTVDEYDNFTVEDIDFDEGRVAGDTVLERLQNFRAGLEEHYA